jgi:hypothetical protein
LTLSLLCSLLSSWWPWLVEGQGDQATVLS